MIGSPDTLPGDVLADALRDGELAMPRTTPRDRTLLEACLQRGLELDHPRATLWSRIALAQLLSQDQHASSAAGELTLALRLAEHVEDFEAVAACRWRMGILWARFGDLGTARHHLDEGLRVARTGGHRLLEAILLTNLAFTWGAEGEPNLYRTLSEEALAHFEALGDHARAQHVLCNLASAIVRQGDLEAAEALYDRVAHTLTPGQAPMLEGIILGGRAEAAFARGQVDRGRSLSEESEAVYEAGGLRYDALRQRVLRASQLTSHGRAEEACALLQTAIAAAEPLELRTVVSEARHKLATAHAALGDFEAAYTTLLRAVQDRDDAEKEEVRQKYALLRDAQTAVDVAQQRIRSEDLARINVRLRETLQERDRLNLELSRYASTDPLTGALNRRGWLAFVETQAREASDPRSWLLLLVDIDDFKAINDQHGHGAGDAVLQDLAQRLQAIVRDRPGAVLRIGGDEFALLVFDPSGDDQASMTSGLQSTRSIPHPLQPTTLMTYQLSLGATPITDWGEVHTALERADATMYLAKRHKSPAGSR